MDEQDWLDKVMYYMQHFNNDMPSQQHLREIGIETTTKPFDKGKQSYILDSYIVDSKMKRNLSTTTIKKHHPTVNTMYMKAKMKNTYFQEQHWIYDKGKWIPPNEYMDDQKNDDVLHICKAVIMDSQSDSGANRIVTNNKAYLHDIVSIPPVHMNSCNKDDDGIVCNEMGVMYIKSKEGHVVSANAY